MPSYCNLVKNINLEKSACSNAAALKPFEIVAGFVMRHPIDQSSLDDMEEKSLTRKDAI